MIGLDTNILVRYLTEDDPVETKAAGRVMDSLSSDSPGFISIIALAELVWVLESFYHFKKRETEHVLETLLRSEELVLERAEIVSQALRMFRGGRASFADCLIERSSRAAGCKLPSLSTGRQSLGPICGLYNKARTDAFTLSLRKTPRPRQDP